MAQFQERFESHEPNGLRGWMASGRASKFVAVFAGVLTLGSSLFGLAVRGQTVPQYVTSLVLPAGLVLLGSALGVYLGAKDR